MILWLTPWPALLLFLGAAPRLHGADVVASAVEASDVGTAAAEAAAVDTAKADTALAAALVIIPTGIQELRELRLGTGRRALQRDGTVNVVYEKKTAAAGNTLLGFSVDLAVEQGPVVLRAADIRLSPAAPGSRPSFEPFDWFLDRGLEEVRGDSLTVADQAILQFTIEAPAAGLDSLVLSVRGQAVGSVAEIRERVRREEAR